MLTNDRIAYLENKGFKRWTMGDKDRLYINATRLGLKFDRYRTGNIERAWFQGKSISNCQARRYLNAKTYIDVVIGELHSDYPELAKAASDVIVLDEEWRMPGYDE